MWSYRVECYKCSHEFQLWDHCRKYGDTVREHKILREFPCPSCRQTVSKSKLIRTEAEPVQIGYKCCGSKQREVTHPPEPEDIRRCVAPDVPPVEGYYPTDELPDGVNLGQPRRHGLTSVDKFYTPRNLVALSHIWHTIHRIDDTSTSAYLGWVFTSLYRRVSRFSEFRFWGGSGNTARLNVPFIFDEPNVFKSYERKAKTILDHASTTVDHYSGRSVVLNGSATDLSDVPDSTVDLVFTDPPFGANINYSEMNFLWESWLGRRTITTEEAIVNRSQGKDIEDYGHLMRRSFEECHRVLRTDGWMLVVFMNSSAKVWTSLREAILAAGFVIAQADVFDKQHGTFKQFVSDNTAGSDLVLHCKRVEISVGVYPTPSSRDEEVALREFLSLVDPDRYLMPYLHVPRRSEVDLRRLYSEWIADSITRGNEFLDFVEFRRMANLWIDSQTPRPSEGPQE